MGKRGFSLIEVMIVVSIIGLIVAVGTPRLRRALEKQNVRSAKALIATMAATARGAAVQRGCLATLNIAADSVWVTACGVNPPAALVQVGTAKQAGAYNVTLSSTSPTIAYDPRGISAAFQRTTVRITSAIYTDSVVINELGKVVKQ